MAVAETKLRRHRRFHVLQNLAQGEKLWLPHNSGPRFCRAFTGWRRGDDAPEWQLD
jgi:hypothetical protein